MNESVNEASQPRYRAFICYSQADHAAAEAIHRRLERYRVPRRLIGKSNSQGPVPKRLYPIFRDRDELAASSDIGDRLRGALARTDFLVVLCSPAAAQSRWVNTEIETFCALNAENKERVLAVLLSGEPLAGDPATECFPPVLLRSDPTATGLSQRYPLAADFRPNRDRRVDAELRLIAALLGVEFDELKRREQECRIGRLRWSLAIAAALGVVFAALAGFALHERALAQEAAARATSVRVEAEKLVEFMVTDLRTRLELIGKLDVLEPANEKVRAYYQSVAPEENDAGMVQRQSAAFQQFAIDLRSHKQGGKTLPVLLTAAALRERLVQLTPNDPVAWRSLAETRRYLGLQHRDDGDLKGALHEFELASAALHRAARLAPGDVPTAARIAGLSTDEADVLMRSGRTREAAARLEESLSTLEELSAREPKNTDIRNRAAAAAWQLGNAYRRLGDYTRAEPAYRRGVEPLRAIASENIFSLRWLANNEGSLGQMLMEAGRNDDAVPVLRSALSTARQLLAVDSASLVHQDVAATQLANLSDALYGLKLLPDALTCVREAVELRERALAHGATDLRTRNVLALALATVATIERELGNGEAATAAAHRGVSIQTEVSQQAPTDLRMRDDLGYLHAKLGSCLLATKQFEPAIAEYQVSLEILGEVLAKDSGNPQLERRKERAEWLLGLGTALREAGKQREAIESLRECLSTIAEAVKEGLPPDKPAATQKEAETLLEKLSRTEDLSEVARDAKSK